MLREIITHSHKAAESTYKAGAPMTTGAAVVKDVAAGVAKFPTEATAANLYFVHKERIPTGINASRTNMSDYDEDYNTVAEDEPVVLYSFDAGEQFATDAFAASLSESDIGKTLAAGTDGKLAVATTTSKYLYKGVYQDAGHALCWVEVLNDAVTNA